MSTHIDKNVRAKEMWRIISKNIDFTAKKVIDLGCGYGDMLRYVYSVPLVKTVCGIEVDVDCILNAFTIMPGNIIVSKLDINDLTQKDDCFAVRFDIAMCFSVLPYLDDIPATLQWMSVNFPLCLIEAQYEPEPYNVGVKDDGEMFELLLANGFNVVEPLGRTHVGIREAWRTIWRCKQ